MWNLSIAVFGGSIYEEVRCDFFRGENNLFLAQEVELDDWTIFLCVAVEHWDQLPIREIRHIAEYRQPFRAWREFDALR